MAKNQGFTVLKFANKRGNLIFDASLIAGVDYEENLVPPNAPDAEQEQEEDESENTADTGSAEEEEEQKIVEHWEKDEEDLEIQNESNQKIHHKDGDMVEDLVYLGDQKADSNHDLEENDPDSEEDQDPRSEREDSEESDDDEKDGPRRSKRSREPPERLNPTMKGQSFAIKNEY